jgi:hypothetical protein
MSSPTSGPSIAQHEGRALRPAFGHHQPRHGAAATRPLAVSPPLAYEFADSAVGANWCWRNVPDQAMRSVGT